MATNDMATGNETDSRKASRNGKPQFGLVTEDKVASSKVARGKAASCKRKDGKRLGNK